MSHVMFDLETWGTSPGCALRSIGAVVFDPTTSNVGEQFYRNIDDHSSILAGLIMEPSTVGWWAQQSKEAQDALKTDAKPVKQVMEEFHDWFRYNDGEFIWCHGANFDEPLWKAVAARGGFNPPWKFWNVRCTRTLYWAAQFDPRTIERKGVAHNALDDAIYQAECVQAAMKKLNESAVLLDALS